MKRTLLGWLAVLGLASAPALAQNNQFVWSPNYVQANCPTCSLVQGSLTLSLSGSGTALTFSGAAPQVATTATNANLLFTPNGTGQLQSTGIISGQVAAQGYVTVSQLPTPTGVTTSTSTTGGTLAAGSYCYRVAAVANTQRTLPSSEVCQTTTGSTSTVTATVPNVLGADSYKFYCRTTGAELLCATVNVNGGASVSWTDTGSVTPSGALPASNTTGRLTAGGGIVCLDSPCNVFMSSDTSVGDIQLPNGGQFSIGGNRPNYINISPGSSGNPTTITTGGETSSSLKIDVTSTGTLSLGTTNAGETIKIVAGAGIVPTTCAMSASTTCTATVKGTGNICTVTNASGHTTSAGYSISGTTLTVTAASSNSDTWSVVCF